MGDNDKYYLTSLAQLEGETHETLSITFLMDRQGGNISETLKEFTREEIIEGLNDLNTDSDTKYSKEFREHKLKLKRLKIKNNSMNC